MLSTPLSMDFLHGLTLAADPRFTETNYADDQIWEISLGGEPPALGLATSLGLRAKSLRLFPAFSMFGETRRDPLGFSHAPELLAALPNYIRIRMRPFDQLQVEFEAWVAESDLVAGRMWLMNLAETARPHRLDLHAILHPQPQGSPMAGTDIEGVQVLIGETAGLQPLLFLGGGAEHRIQAYPSLSLEHHLPSNEPVQVAWAIASTDDPTGSFQRVRGWSGADWHAEVSRLELENSRWIRIESGNPEWDAAFALAQRAGLGAFVSGTRHLPEASLVGSRLPDDGYSESGTGRDHRPSWNGQDAWAAAYVAEQILPAAPDLASGLLRNYLHIQAANGEIDAAPGLSGQRTQRLAPPVLCTLAWQIYRQTGSRRLLQEVYPGLKSFAMAWLSAAHDRDRDGVPEWSDELQSGFPDSPHYARWGKWGERIDPTVVEAPDLIAYLLREFQCLAAMANELDQTQELAQLEPKLAGLRSGLDRCWDDELGRFHPVDRDLHYGQSGSRLSRGKGAFSRKPNKRFKPEVRLVVRVTGEERRGKSGHVTIHGRGPKGQFRKVRLESRSFSWFWEHGSATTEATFSKIEKIEVAGFPSDFRTEVHVADHRRLEISALMPLWSGAADPTRITRLIDQTLLDERLWRAGGVAAVAADDPGYDPESDPAASGVRLPWNSLLAVGLAAHDRPVEAAELVSRLMNGCVAALKSQAGFHGVYHPDRYAGLSNRGSVLGLAPLAAFLFVLGVRFTDSHTVEVRGINPFPWPVTVHWRGVQVTRPREGPTTVIFADGAVSQVEPEEAVRLSSTGEGAESAA